MVSSHSTLKSNFLKNNFFNVKKCFYGFMNHNQNLEISTEENRFGDKSIYH